MIARRVVGLAASLAVGLSASLALAQANVIAAAQNLTLDRVEAGRAQETLSAWLQRVLGVSPQQAQWRSGRCRQEADNEQTSYDYPVCATAELHWQPGVILRIDVGFDAGMQPQGVRGVLHTARARNWCDIYQNPSEIESRALGAVQQIVAAGGTCL